MKSEIQTSQKSTQEPKVSAALDNGDEFAIRRTRSLTEGVRLKILIPSGACEGQIITKIVELTTVETIVLLPKSEHKLP